MAIFFIFRILHQEGASMRNLKLFPYYIGFTYDFLFFGTVQVLFLLLVKGISASEILFLESFFALVRLIIQIPLTKITKRLGNVFALRAGPIFTVLCLICFIIAPNIGIIILAYIFKAIGWGFQNLSYPSLIYYELRKDGKEKEYNIIQGKGQSIFSLVGAISSFFAGVLFDVNAFIPIIICIVFHLVVIVISFKIDVPNIKSSNENIQFFVKLRKVLNIKFFWHLFLFTSFAWGILGAYSRMNTTYFEVLNVSATNIGIIFGLAGIIGYLVSKYQYKIELVLKNQAFNIFAFILTVPFLILGLLYYLNININTLILLGIVLTLGDQFVRSSFRIYTLEYLNSNADDSLRQEALSLYYLFESLGRIVITFIAGIILNHFDIGVSYIVFVLILIIPTIIVTSLLSKDLKKQLK